jgi:hypothetical protein
MNRQRMIKKLRTLSPQQKKDVASVIIEAMNIQQEQTAALFRGVQQNGWKADRWRGYFTKLSKVKSGEQIQ